MHGAFRRTVAARFIDLPLTRNEDERRTVLGMRHHAGGVTMPKDITGHAALQQAYELGKKV
jgi:hypothetical protein